MIATTEIAAQLDEAIDIRLAQLDFWEFCLFMDAEFFTARPFLRKIARAFQKLYDSYLQGIAIKISASLPPRSGKSYITSLFCAWWLGKLPEQAVMRNTVTSSLYRKFSYDIRNILKDKKYLKVFPHVVLSPDKQNIDGWSITRSKQGAYFGGGVGTNIIGFGANLAITDDLYSGFEQAVSENYNESVFRWKQGSHNSRMEKNCPEIYIGTRWSKSDVIGKALEDGQVDIEITIPALVVNEAGELVSFCEAVKSTEEYLKIKDETDEEIWSAEYQQEPIEIKGLLFPKSELKSFRPENLIGQPEYKYMAVDPADTNDFTAAPCCAVYGSGVYVYDVVFNNNGTDSTIPQLVEKIIKEQMNHVEIEGVSAWKLFGAQVRNDVNERYEDCEIRIIKSVTGNKDVRIQQWSAFIKSHFYFLDEEFWTPEYRAFMKNLTGYLREGKSKNDDAPDATAICAAFFKRNFSHIF
jgi:predicted phage terminase large subunit-like protein